MQWLSFFHLNLCVVFSIPIHSTSCPFSFDVLNENQKKNKSINKKLTKPPTVSFWINELTLVLVSENIPSSHNFKQCDIRYQCVFKCYEHRILHFFTVINFVLFSFFLSKTLPKCTTTSNAFIKFVYAYIEFHSTSPMEKVTVHWCGVTAIGWYDTNFWLFFWCAPKRTLNKQL